MKINLLGKFKWYIVGFILVAIMLSVSLSFCAWDTLSLQAKMSASKSGSYKEYIKLVEDIYLSNGEKGVNAIADVGDIVTFGNYYQSANNNTKSDIRWIVVHKENNQLTLLAEKVMAFGCSWGTYYYDSNNAGDWASTDNGIYYQNYSLSTVRAWLNSNYALRNDGGTPFSADHNKPAFRGFLSEAFTADEQEYIIPKIISGIKGYGINGQNPDSAIEEYAPVTDKVWLPSYSEVYGTTNTPYVTPTNPLGTTIDGSPSTRFSYFNNTAYDRVNEILVGKTTAYASTAASNYTTDNADLIGSANYQGSLENRPVDWRLRSPHPSEYSCVLAVNGYGTVVGYAWTDNSSFGIRPAVCVQL